MAQDTLTTESGDILMMETVAGISGASSLNDISIVTIYKETFDTSPTTRGWTIGTDWEWDAVNLRMKIV
jgi:hypothetical protein